jgi:peroxiredoxin Q/BCP
VCQRTRAKVAAPKMDRKLDLRHRDRFSGISKRMSLNLGDTAPAFESTTHDGKLVKLADFKGNKNVVLYFYPKDETRVCTAEACGFRDAYEDLMAQDTEVIGVSFDSGESHAKFAARHHLPFLLLSDTDGSIAKAYGAKSFLGSLLKMPTRVTFLIDKQGHIAGIFKSAMSADVHVDGIRDAVKNLSPTSAVG